MKLKDVVENDVEYTYMAGSAWRWMSLPCVVLSKETGWYRDPETREFAKGERKLRDGKFSKTNRILIEYTDQYGEKHKKAVSYNTIIPRTDDHRSAYQHYIDVNAARREKARQRHEKAEVFVKDAASYGVLLHLPPFDGEYEEDEEDEDESEHGYTINTYDGSISFSYAGFLAFLERQAERQPA